MRYERVFAFIVTLFVVVGMSFSSPARAGDQSHEIIYIHKKDSIIRAESPEMGKVLFKNQRAKDVIEWALGEAEITVLRDGKFQIIRTVMIPESDVALVIGPDAELEAAPHEDAKLTTLTEGHNTFAGIIHNQRRDNVKIVNLGTLDAGGKNIHPDKTVNDYRYRGEGYDDASANILLFDGRNNGSVGINGGLIFSPGKLERAHDPMWVVDSANLDIPFIWKTSGGNVPLVLEGCEDCRIGTVIELGGEKSWENEAIDFNSFNERIEVDMVIGMGPVTDEILDINNTPNSTINKVVGFGPVDPNNLVSINQYGPGGRRLTQKSYIGHSNGTVVKDKKVVDKEVADWNTEVEVTDFPESLPVIKVKPILTVVYEDGAEEEVFAKSYQIDLKQIDQ